MSQKINKITERIGLLQKYGRFYVFIKDFFEKHSVVVNGSLLSVSFILTLINTILIVFSVVLSIHHK